MAAEIRILSGARKGERIVLEATEFRVGADRQCQVYFDPRLDPAAQHRSVLLRRTNDGWLVSSIGGGEVLLNQAPIVKETRIRSGDLVRLSDRGPDFSFAFAIANQPTPVVHEAGYRAADPQLAAPETHEGAASAAAPEAADASNHGGLHDGRAKLPSEPVQHPWKRFVWVGVFVCALTVLVATGLLGVLRQPRDSGDAAQEGRLEIEELATCSVREGSEVALEVRVRMTGTLHGHPVFILTNNPPHGATIDQQTGVFTWTPTEKDGPGRYKFHVRVTLEKVEGVSAESEFRIDVTEVNSPLSIRPIGEKEVAAGQELNFTIATEDTDQPVNPREFQLMEGPVWISIDPTSGAVRCTPPKSVDGRFEVTIRVCDNGALPLEDQATFGVVVHGDPWLHVQHELQESLYMVHLQLSGPGGDVTWPFATCSAIGGRTLLTSAREVLLLAGFRAQGYRVFAINPSTGLKTDIRSLRVRREFAAVADAPSDWIFVNLGLLETERELPKIAPLATAEELASLEEGLPVACIGYPHDGSKITRFDSFEPQVAVGKVYLMSSLTCQNKVARLVELKGKIPDNVFGSPILNQRGAIVAVYGESATREDTVSVRDLHYAPVLDLGSLQSWLHGIDNGEWVTPPMTETISSSPDQPLNQPKRP
jgi:hypothetical protein